MFPCILQLFFLVVELTRILISLGKSLGWKGSLFRLESGLSGARFQRRNSESLESDGSLCLQVSGSQSSPVGWSRAWEHDVVYAVVLALANGIPVPPHALM